MTIGELVWKISGDTKGIDKSLKKTDKGIAKFGKSVKAAFSIAAVVLFAKKAVDVSKVLIGMASDAEETAQKFSVVFDGINEASGAADELANSYGLSHQASQELLSGTADLLQGFGVAKGASLDLSTKVQKLAVDLASFSNYSGGAKGASEALTKALLGERESVKALGIAITESELKSFAEEQGQVYKELTKAEKAVLTLDLAYKQSANSIGDFARSNESFANQLRIAQAATQDLGAVLGESLLPIATKAVTAFAKVIKKITEAITEARTLKNTFSEGSTSSDKESSLVVLRKQAAELREELDVLANKKGVDTEEFTAGVNELSNALLAGGERAKDANKVLQGMSYGSLAQQEISGLIISLAEAESGIRTVERALASQKRAELELKNQTEETSEAIVAAKEEEVEATKETAVVAEETAEEEVEMWRDAYVKRLSDRYAFEEETRLLVMAADAKRAEAIELEAEQEEARHQAKMKNILDELAEYSRYAGNVGQIFGNLIRIQMAGDEELTDKKKKNIIALYRIQQAANIAQIVIDTATATMKALSTLGPIAGAIAAVFIGTLGATQAGIVAATPPPVALADGGIIPARPGGTQAIIGEAGKAEAVIPLDEAGGFGQTRITVNLDGQPILEAVQSALNRRDIVVEAGSVI